MDGSEKLRVMIEEITKKLLTTITEPFMLLALIVIFGLWKLLMQREATLKEALLVISETKEGLAACNESICGVVPLLEVLVYGKGGKKNV